MEEGCGYLCDQAEGQRKCLRSSSIISLHTLPPAVWDTQRGKGSEDKGEGRWGHMAAGGSAGSRMEMGSGGEHTFPVVAVQASCMPQWCKGNRSAEGQKSSANLLLARQGCRILTPPPTWLATRISLDLQLEARLESGNVLERTSKNI